MTARALARVRALRVDVSPVQDGRTDLICIVCGYFRTQFEILAGGQAFGMPSHAGIHTKCWQALRTAKRDARRQKRLLKQQIIIPKEPSQ